MLAVSLAHLGHVLLLIGLGICTGMLSGLLGIGGGVIIVPSLLAIFHMMGLAPTHLMQYAIGTSLGVMVINSLSASTFHIRKEKPNAQLLLKILPFVCLGVIVGASLAHLLSTAWLKRIFAILLLFIAYKMITGKKNQEGQVDTDNLPMPTGGGLGGIVGFCSGLLGIGGGVITVPFLLHKHFSYRQSIIIALLMSFVGAITGVIVYMVIGMHNGIATPKGFIGNVYLSGAILVGIGAIPGSFLASKILPHCRVLWLKRVFAVLMLLTAAHLLIP